MAQRATDRFANIGSAHVLQSSANAETFTELTTGISLGQGIGILIDEIDYYINQPTVELLIALGDELIVGWTVSNASGSIGVAQRRTIHVMAYRKGAIIGVGASSQEIFVQPTVFQFFPPLIIAAPRIYLAVASTSLGSAADVNSRIFFRFTGLSAQEYLELAETFQLVG